MAAPMTGEQLLRQLGMLPPAKVVEAVLEVPFEIHGTVIKIVACSCSCGGDYAWMHQRDTGAWEMKGCVCHNPALGV